MNPSTKIIHLSGEYPVNRWWKMGAQKGYSGGKKSIYLKKRDIFSTKYLTVAGGQLTSRV
jgi:hypothetical protein